MPGRLFLETDLAHVALAVGATDWPKDECPRRNIAPGQDIIVLQNGVLARMRWGMIPVGRVNARGRPVMETIINARSETVFDKSAFEGVSRAVVPADGWYEWTGKARRKQPWRLRDKAGDLLFFTAITDSWVAPGGTVVPQVATVTCEPNADVQPIHHRMGALLKQGDISTWLEGSDAAAKALLRPLPDGELLIEKADDVDWSAA
ncbi:MAG: SOS response-associated peptidase [Pseudomonadota bacterium]